MDFFKQASTEGDTPNLGIPDTKTPEELGIDISKGPNFDSVHSDADTDHLLKVSKEVSNVIDEYIDERIITDKEAEQLEYSQPFKTILSTYRYFTKQYFTNEYIIDYKADSHIKDAVQQSGELKDIIHNNRTFLLLFLEPKFLSLIFVFLIVHTTLQFTILPNTQNFRYDDIPKSAWYFPMYITRFLGNVALFIFYFSLMMWAGARKLVNENSSIPMNILYITFMFILVQVILLTYLTAVSGEFPESGVKDSSSVVLGYMIPLILFSFIPNLTSLIPSDFVRRHQQVPILPTNSNTNPIQYSFDLDILNTYLKGRFWQNSAFFVVLYIFFTYAFYPLDPSITTFIRDDLKKLQHRADIQKPAAFYQSATEKLFNAIVYHGLTMLIVIISSISITALPKPYDKPSGMFNNALLFSSLLAFGKFIVELKYRSNEMDFYGTFYDLLFTILRIMIPIGILTNMDRVMQLLSFLIYFDSNHALPEWMTYTFVAGLCLLLICIVRATHPPSQQSNQETFTFQSATKEFERIEKAESSTRELLQKAKDLFHSFQKRT